jgi:MFS family permease
LTGLLLMAIGTFGSVLAWSYGALLACRLLTGVGAAMIPPNSIAAIADHFSPAERGTPISVLISVPALSVWSSGPPWSRSSRISGGGGGRSTGWEPC